jgi:hypothetical protein
MSNFTRRILTFAIPRLLKRRWGRALLVGGGVAAFRASARNTRHYRDPYADMMRRYMQYVLLPLWFVPGIADWAMHRRTRISRTSGLAESVMHSVMMTEVGLPILMGLLLEINAGVIAAMLGAAFLHWGTAWLDISYTTGRREIRPTEQHIHSFIETLPFWAVSFVCCLEWKQFFALFGQGPEKPDFSLRIKNPPLPSSYIGGIFSAILALIALPYGEELVRCWLAERRGLIEAVPPRREEAGLLQITDSSSH